jgi:hypothetical protein
MITPERPTTKGEAHHHSGGLRSTPPTSTARPSKPRGVLTTTGVGSPNRTALTSRTSPLKSPAQVQANVGSHRSSNETHRAEGTSVPASRKSRLVSTVSPRHSQSPRVSTAPTASVPVPPPKQKTTNSQQARMTTHSFHDLGHFVIQNASCFANAEALLPLPASTATGTLMPLPSTTTAGRGGGQQRRTSATLKGANPGQGAVLFFGSKHAKKLLEQEEDLDDEWW